jgi:hypothetical protein
MKPIIKTGIIALVIVIVGLIIYFVWSGLTSSPSPVPNTGEGGQDVNLPIGSGSDNTPGDQSSSTSAGSETPQILDARSLVKISETPAFDYWIDIQTKEIYYIAQDGKIWSAKNGEDLKISDQKLTALNSIEIEPSGQKILAAFGDPRAPQWAIFDVIDGTWKPLPSEVTEATWGANPNEVIAMLKNLNGQSLVKLDVSKNPPSQKIIIGNFYFYDVKLKFIPPNQLMLVENGSASYNSRVWQLDLKSLSFNLMFSPTQGLDFSSNLEKSLFFEYSGSDSNFYVLDRNLKTYPPAIFTTMSSKCDRAANASSTAIYCFGFQEVPEDKTLPDDYLEKNFFSTDNLYFLTLSSGDVRSLLLSNRGGVPPIDGKNPQFFDGKLYFINRYDNMLYSLVLSSGD